MLNIMIVDDHSLIRKGLRLLLKGNADFAVTAEAASGVVVRGTADPNAAVSINWNGASLTAFRSDARLKDNIVAMQEFIYGQSYYKEK